MRVVLGLAALATAGLAAVIFPDMKKLLLAIPFGLLLLALLGCTSGLAGKLHKMPDGQFTRATFEETGKFTHTKIDLTGVRKDNGVLTAATIAIDHNDPWFQHVKFNADNYEVQLSREAQKKPLSPQVPAKEADVRGQMPEASTPAPVPVPLPVFDAKLGPIAPH